MSRITDFIKTHKQSIIIWSLFIAIDIFLTVILGYICGALYNGYKWSDFSHSNGTIIFLVILVINVLVAIGYYFIYTKLHLRDKAEIRRSKNNVYGSAQFLIDERKKHLKYSEIKRLNEKYPNTGIGWVLKAKYHIKENNTTFNISRTDTFTHHIAVLGATRSGKTQIIILLTIVYNAKVLETEDIKKPSFVITDIKGEICRNTYKTLKENGYEVLLFNLKDSAHSNTWNPLLSVTNNYIEAELLLKQISEINENEKINILIKADKLKDEAENLLHEIINLIFPITAKSDNQVFDTLAQSAFYTAYYFSVETLIEKNIEKKNFEEINKEILNREINNINIPSLLAVLNRRSELDNYIKTIQNINDYDLRQKFSNRKSFEYGSKLFILNENTISSAFANLTKTTNTFNNNSIKRLIMTNEIELDKLVVNEKPKAVFLVVAGGNETSYKFLAMFIDQLYSSLIKIAESKSNGKLPRQCLILMDEFANMPKLAHASSLFTLGAGRGILCNMVIQSLEQLRALYGKETASTILENCSLQVYLKSTDMATNEYYSKLAGNYTAEASSVSESNTYKKKLNQNNMNISTSLKEMKLLTPEELKNNPLGMLIAFNSYLSEPAYLKSNFFYECKNLSAENLILKNENEIVKIKSFNIQEHLFDPFKYESEVHNEAKKLKALELFKTLIELTNKFIHERNKYDNKPNLDDSSIFKTEKAINELTSKFIKFKEFQKMILYDNEQNFSLYRFILQNIGNLISIKSQKLLLEINENCNADLFVEESSKDTNKNGDTSSKNDLLNE